MQTKHYIVNNIMEFTGQTESVKKLEEYLDCIEEVAFPTIEEVFGQIWSDNKINIELDNSIKSPCYKRKEDSHIVKMQINNKNIQKKYPENLWGCLFHETHHAFLNQIIHKKRDGKIFNGGHKAEVFNFAFMATTYLKLKENDKIDKQVYKYFLSKLERELDYSDKKFCALDKYERELPNNAMDIFKEYINMFSKNIKSFATFIDHVRSYGSVFVDVNNFRQDLDEVKKILMN